MRLGQLAYGVILVSFFSLGSVSYGADIAKIGIVDFQRILDTSSAGKSARAEITKKGKIMEVDLKKKGAGIQESKKKLEQEALVMKKEIREEKEREIRIRINDLKGLQKKYTEDFKKFENRFVKRIQSEVLELIKEIGKKGGYLLIVEKREGGVLYAPKTIDITDKLIRQYNTQFARKIDRGGKAKKK